jgi:hypothetical protein
MNPNAIKYLESVASTLPFLVDEGKNVYVEKKGQELLDSGIFNDKLGVPIIAKRTYLVKVPAVIDHLKHLKYAWQRGKGQEQKEANVQFYVNYITEKFTKKQINEVSTEPA